MRLEFSRKTKEAAFDRCGGRCDHCGVALTAATGIEYDHIIRCELRPDNGVDNCSPLCRNCHADKTHRFDIPQAAKGRRIRSKRIGADQKRGRPLPGTKRSGWRKRMDGTVERR